MQHFNDNKPDQKIKKQIGDYVFGKTLGQGTFGKVKLAIHKPTNQQVAIKILQKQKIIDVADVQRVSREIHILKLIRHPNIIQLYQIIQTPKYLFLVMEFVENGQLFDYIVKNKRLKQQEACKLYNQLINGIQYIHKLNIVHRDLKPQNLLLDYNKSLKLVDFGLSNTYKKDQTLKTPCGSPCYAAPQMIKGQKYQGLKVDIWSSGVILFAMLCGCLPFQDPNTSNLYKKILSGKFTTSKSLSNQAKDLLSKILQVDPAKRITIQQIRQHRWASLNTQTPNNEGIIIGYNRMPIEQRITKELREMGTDELYIRKCIQANRHNSVTTGYYLLFKKFLKNGGSSECDMSSKYFNKRLIEPIKRNNEKSKSRLIMQDLLELNKEQKIRLNGSKNNIENKFNNQLKQDNKLNENRNQRYNCVINRYKQNKQNLKINECISRGRSKDVVTSANRINKRYRQQFNKSLISKSNERHNRSNSKYDKNRGRSNITINNTKQINELINSISKAQHKQQLFDIGSRQYKKGSLFEDINLSKTIKSHKRGRSNNISINKKNKINQSINSNKLNDIFLKRSQL